MSDAKLPLVGSRSEARETALAVLYEAEINAAAAADTLAGQAVAVEDYPTELILGVGEHLERIDEVLEQFSDGWTVNRMPVIDRLILRIAAFELMHRPDVPTGVILHEAVELATRYSTEKSPPFVNGLLAGISRDVRE